MISHLNEALAALRELGRAHGRHVVLFVRCDGRVQILFEDFAGWSKESVEADLLPGGSLPLPAEALNAVEWKRVGE